MIAVARPRTAESLAAPPPLDALLLVIALTGVSFSGPLMAATAAPAFAISLWRNALGAGVAASLVIARGLRDIRRLSRRTWATAGLAGVALAVHFATWVPSLTMTTVASATALVCTQPIFTGLIALITGADLHQSTRALAGDLLAIAGGLGAAAYVTIGASARTKMTTASYTAVCYATCAVLLLAACLIGSVGIANDA